MPKVKIKKGLKGKNLVSIDDLTPQLVLKLFQKSSQFSKNPKSNSLKDKIVALLFFEPSSRTFSSFGVAIKRLGGQTLEFQNPKQTSSLVKGESFEDTIKVFSVYSDAIVMRHDEIGKAFEATLVSSKPVINAGDGGGSHPTQMLLDLYTISKHFGPLENLKVVACGDILHSRTIHSLIEGLALFRGNTVYLLSPKELKLDKNSFQKIQDKGIRLIEIHKEQDIPKDADVWYWNRIQKERFSSEKEAIKHIKSFVLTTKLLGTYGNKKLIILDPLPRVGEIEEAVDNDPRALYLKEQLQNGIYVRMALLDMILG